MRAIHQEIGRLMCWNHWGELKRHTTWSCLSGTLLWNILNLVHPKFLKMDLSRPHCLPYNESGSSIRLQESKSTDSVETALLYGVNFTRKAHFIRCLRDLTKDVIRYYKGNTLDELPGLIDFSLFLMPTPRQKDIVCKIEYYVKLKIVQ
jgi:DNA repair and recombination RAD54-like protein